MALAIIGDTHMPKGDRRLPDACLQLLRTSELIIHTGDFTGVEAHDLIAGLGVPLMAVHGNVDESELVRALPEALTFPAPCGSRIGLIHDAGAKEGRLERLSRRFPDADTVLFGHSHLPLHEQDPDGFQIFNPGSPTERRRAPRRSMGLAEVGEGGVLTLSHVWLD